MNNKRSNLILSLKQGRYHYVKGLIENMNEKAAQHYLNIKYKGTTALILAIELGQLEIAYLLIKKGANLNLKDDESQETALMKAIFCEEENSYECIELVKLLIEKGANLNLISNRGNTALMSAIKRGKEEIAKLLIQNGANLNKQNNEGDTALIISIRFMRIDTTLEITSLLIEKGANVNLQNKKGETALMQAVRLRNSKLIELLINNGADLNLQNAKGETALMLALRNKMTKLVKLFIEYGARLDVGKWSKLNYNRFKIYMNEFNRQINNSQRGGSQYIHIPSYGRRKVRYQKNGRAYVIVNKKKLKL